MNYSGMGKIRIRTGRGTGTIEVENGKKMGW